MTASDSAGRPIQLSMLLKQHGPNPVRSQRSEFKMWH